MKKTLFALLLTGLLLVIAACKSGEAGNQTDISFSAADSAEEAAESVGEAPDAPDAIDYESDLSTARYDGYDYRIYVRKGRLHYQYFDEPQENVVDDALYRRNKAVEDRYGVNIVVSESPESNTDTSALNSILAGDDSFDLILTHARSAYAYATQGACYDLHDLKELHLDKPWWTKDIVEESTINGKLYVINGDFSINALEHAMCIFFNKRIFDELGFDYPYETVRDGEWTFDEFSYLAKKGAADLNGDGVMKIEDDRYGYIDQVWYGPVNVLYAGGERIYAKDETGALALTMYSNKTVQIFNAYFNLMNNEGCFLGAANGVFTGGRAMMSCYGLGSASGFRNMDDDFGIVPYPKFDEDDEYHCACNAVHDLAVIPITVSDPDRTGAITEALCAYGSEYVVPAFYDVTLKTKSARDEESAEMMDIIKESIVFDIAYAAGTTLGNGGAELCAYPDHNFSSWYAARESGAKEALVSFVANYAGE